MDSNETLINLIYPANRAVKGPKLTKERECLIVEYDYELDDGRMYWSKIIFSEVIALEWRDNTCCTAEDVINAKTIRCTGKSEFLEKVIKNRTRTGALTKWDEKRGGVFRFKHFTQYFDDVGALNVIAGKCEVLA